VAAPRAQWAAALAVVFACSAAAYALTADGGVDFGDYGDFQTVPYILGIAYPTGFPGYTLLGWVWSHALPFGPVALRLNVMAVFAAVLGNVLLAGLLMEIGITPLLAALSTLAYALSYPVWTHAGAANPHELGTCLLIGALVAAVAWMRTESGKWLAGAVIAFAVAVACDNSTILALPGLLVLLLCRRIAAGRAAMLTGAALLIVTGAYAYLPLRSADVTARGLDPTMALGLPPGSQFWDQGHPSTVHTFYDVVAGGGFQAPAAFATMLLPQSILRTWNDLTGQVTSAFGPLALGVALIAIVLFIRDQRRVGIGIALASVITALYITAFRAESDVGRYVPRELILVVAATAWLCVRSLQTRTPLALAGRALVAIGALSVVIATWGNPGRVARDSAARDARDVARLVQELAPDTVIVAPWKYAAPAAYTSYATHELSGGIVVCCDLSVAVPHVNAWTLDRDVVYLGDPPPPNEPRLELQPLITGPVGVWRVVSAGETRNPGR
jgi:hypothetical protein